MANASRRYYRTIFLGLAAMALLIWSAMDQFGISAEEMLTLFYGALVALVIVVVCAALMASLWIGLRKILRDKDA